MHANRPMAMLLPAPSFAKPDIVRRFLAFAQCAGPEKRAEAASALARAYLHSDLAEPMRAEAELAMTALLDDPFPLVRRALADALGSAGGAPRPLIRALAFDQPDVAAAVLARSPVLTDADLVDCVAAADVVAQSALARRPDLKPGAIAALAETAQREALLALDRQSRGRARRRRADPHIRAFRRRPRGARGAARASGAAAGLEGADRCGDGEGSQRRGVAVAASRPRRTCRPRGARSGDLFDRLGVPGRRASGSRAFASRMRGADAGLAFALAARRRPGAVRRRAGGIVRSSDVARGRLLSCPARGRLRGARPQGGPERPSHARLRCRARRAQDLRRRARRRAQAAAGARQSSTNANGAAIRRWPRSWRCFGASPPRR